MEKIDKQFFKRLRLTLSLSFLSSKGKLNLPCLVALLVLLTGLMEQILTYFIGLIPSGYYRILIEKDWTEFIDYTTRSFLLVLVMVLIKSTKQLMAFQTNIAMRQNMTVKLHNQYMSKNGFCYLNVTGGNCDNPDQRITRDVDAYCVAFSTMVPQILISPFTITYYTYQTVVTAGWAAPAIIIGFFILATFINKYFIAAAGKRVFLKQREEGNLRHKHSALRSNAESCAYYGQPGSVFEKLSLNDSLQQLVIAMYRLSITRYFLDLASSFCEYSGSILTYFIIAIPLQAGMYDQLSKGQIGALISKNSFVCMYLIYCFTSLIGLNDEMSEFVGVIHRIGQLCDYMNPTSKHCDNMIAAYQYEEVVPLISCIKEPISLSDITRRRTTIPDGSLLMQLRGLSVVTPLPDSKLLVSNLSIDIKKGYNWLITGPSGCGKSSLFRTLAGIWPVGGGEYELFCNGDPEFTEGRECFFLPQLAYVTVGTVADNLIFPFSRSSLTSDEEDRMEKVLKVTGLYNRVISINKSSVTEESGGPPASLTDVLSPGEIQRFMFARLLFHSPLIAFIDEPTSSLDEEYERQMFRVCEAAGITLVTIAHRPERLSNFHTNMLKLSTDNPNSWKITSLA